MYCNTYKRIFDILVSIASLILLSPILIFTGIAVFLYDRGSIFFYQDRIGLNGNTFRLIKFRSMPENTGDHPSIEAAKIIVTPIGRIIRRTNIDELPQLFNILIGEMSIVGPRPSLQKQIRLNSLRKKHGVFTCRPGLTGLAQVNSYDGMSEEEKVEWDKKYSKNINLLSDISIVLKTFKYLLKRPPIY